MEPTAAVVTPLPSRRDAEPYERLRDAADAELARTGVRPTIFLATLGAPADVAERAGFAKTFFEVGGIAAVAGDGLASAEAAAAAFAASGARLACLCLSDRLDGHLAASMSAALRQAGARALYVAGEPERLQEHLRGAGVVSYIFPGCDAVAILGEALEAAAA